MRSLDVDIPVSKHLARRIVYGHVCSLSSPRSLTTPSIAEAVGRLSTYLELGNLWLFKACQMSCRTFSAMISANAPKLGAIHNLIDGF